MNVTFTEKHMSANSGWSLYMPGQKATFPARRAQALVGAGVARAGWGAAPAASPVVNYDLLTIKELKAIAKERGVPGYYRMSKSKLVAALSDG